MRIKLMGVGIIGMAMVGLMCVSQKPSPSKEANKPNIILIMADDIGYEAFGSYGNTNFKTPRIDQMARQGMQFNHCYSQPLCTPSRVKIMTGKYNFRNYHGFGELDPHETTFAHILKPQGYATCIAGKWQLRGDEYAPYKAGFDDFHVWQLTFTSYNERYKNPRVIENGQLKKYTNGEYGPQLHTDFIMNFMEEHQDEPFFAYYPMALTHRPYVPTPDSKDWDDVEIPGDGNAHNTVSDPKYFKDEVAYLDNIVGQLIDKTVALGIDDNTLILFTGDNGTGKGLISQLGDKVVRGAKGSTHKYGTHVPLIALWPGTIQAGQQNDNLIDFSDFLPTIAQATGSELPNSFVSDGVSFYPQLNGDFSNTRDWNYCYYDPGKEKYPKKVYVQNQEWKLYESGDFFNVKNDPMELSALANTDLSQDAIIIIDEFQEVLDRMKKEGEELKIAMKKG
ncbi:MAG: arylsulfatase A [Saprospiraceae bacterium]|jgi:arylsulfatase A